jgi:hypothetical protein
MQAFTQASKKITSRFRTETINANEALFPAPMKPTLSLLALTVAPLFAQTTITYQSYNPADGQFDLTQNIDYYLPDPIQFGRGPYPVFVYVPGTFETYNDSLALLFVNGCRRGAISLLRSSTTTTRAIRRAASRINRGRRASSI